MGDRELERFEEAFDPKYRWIMREGGEYSSVEFVLESHGLERKIVVGKDDNQVKLYDTSHPTGVGEADWMGTDPNESAEQWVKQQLNYIEK